MEAERLIAYFEGDLSNLRSAKQEADKIFDSLENRIKNLTSTIKIDTKSGSKSGVDQAMREAFSTIDKYRRENAKAEHEITKNTEREEKSRADIRAREARRSANELIKTLGQIQKESESVANSSKNVFSSVFSGSFFGSLAGNITSFFLNKLAELPAKVKELIGDMVGYAENRTNALKGVESTANFKGIDEGTAQQSIKNLRLVKAGILDVTDAATAYKNLIGSGFTDKQAVTVLERFSDAAAFGKQQALTFGEAISRAGEGIKNQNSALVDNVGLTKNLSVILKERGFELQDLGDKQKGQNALLALYNGILEETKGQIGDADKLTQGYTGTTAALDQAQKNLYATFGDLIIQSPQMRESNKVLTEQINEYSGRVNTADSETGKFTRNSVARYAELRGASISLAASIVETFKMSGYAVVTGVSGILVALTALVEGALAPIRQSFYMVQKSMTDLNNFAYDNIPQGALAAVGLGNFGLKRMENPAEPEYFKYTRRAAQMTSEFAESVKNSYLKVKAYGDEFDKARERIRNAPNNITIAPKMFTGDGKRLIPGVTDSPADGGISNLKGKKRKAKNEDGRTSADIAAVAKSLGFNVGSLIRGNLNEGSLHSSGKALDISIKGKSEQEIAELIAALLKKGFRVVDERMKIPGVYQSGPHIHSEVNDRKESYLAWNDKLKYGNIPVKMLRELDEQRFSKARGGIDKGDIERFKAKESDDLTKEKRDKKLRETFDFFKKMGWSPGAFLDDFTRLMVDDAKNAGFVQPTQAEVKKIFDDAKNTAESSRAQEIKPDAASLLSRNVTPIRTPDDEFISGLRESLGFKERYANLLLSEKNLDAEISTIVEDRNLQLKEAATIAQKEFGILQQRNLAEEISVGLLQGRNDQIRQLGDVERDLSLFKAQNNDAEFVANRRLITVKSEQLSLEQQLAQLQDDVVNGSVNQGLRVQVALLQDVLQLRELENQKIIEANRSIQYRMQVQLAQLPSYGTQIKEFFGNLPTAFGDMFAQGLQSWDGTWKGFLQNLKQSFAQMLQDLAAQMLRSAIIQLVTKLLSSVIGGAFGGGGAGLEGASGGWGTGPAGLPGLASGGTAVGGMAHFVGENGPEIFVPQHSGAVINNRETKKMLGENHRGGNTTINFTQNISAPRGLVSPKSRQQTADAALSGLGRLTRNKG